MSPTPPISQELWDQIPVAAQAAVFALVQTFEQRVAALEARLGQDSTNSSRPPSSDPPHVKRKPPRPPSGKRRGGQPGHGRHTRELVPPGQLTDVLECKPTACRGCGHDLHGADPEPIRRQVAELPTERQAAEALAGPVEAVYEHVRSAGSVGVDETGWREDKKRAWLWAAVTGEATAFRIARSRGADALHAMVGDPVAPVIISDRFPTYARAPARQVCWAHLRRDMQAMIDRDGDGAEVGRQLLWQSNKLFEAWHKARDGTIQRSTFLQTVAWLRPMVRSSLERGSRCACEKTAATCGELLRLWDCLWTFTRVDGVEPTNNAAERALRHAVIWRRISGGTDSEVGSRFVERMLSAVATCRQRGVPVLQYLGGCHEARLNGRPIPSLLAGPPRPAASAT
jgi:transposase